MVGSFFAAESTLNGTRSESTTPSRPKILALRGDRTTLERSSGMLSKVISDNDNVVNVARQVVRPSVGEGEVGTSIENGRNINIGFDSYVLWQSM